MLYRYLTHKDKKYPIRISNSVLGEYSEETGKASLGASNMNFRDIRILMWHSLQEGYLFADKKFDLTMKDVRLMVDDSETVSKFLMMIPEFFPPAIPEDDKKDDKKGGKKASPTTK